jgi:hypothetical protein
VSVTEKKASSRCQVWIKKTNTSELPFRRRNIQMMSKPWNVGVMWDRSSGNSVYWLGGIRRIGSVILILVLKLNTGICIVMLREKHKRLNTEALYRGG